MDSENNFPQHTHVCPSLDESLIRQRIIADLERARDEKLRSLYDSPTFAHDQFTLVYRLIVNEVIAAIRGKN